MKNFVYHNQIVHHKPCFNLFRLHNNLFDNQGNEINKNNIFCEFRHTVFRLVREMPVSQEIKIP